MELQEIDVFIGKDGQVRLEVRGVKGEQCLLATRGLEQVLGEQILQREMTAEASETPEQNADQSWVGRNQ